MTAITPVSIEQCKPHFSIDAANTEAFDRSLEIHLPELQSRLDSIMHSSAQQKRLFITIQAGIDWYEAGSLISDKLAFPNATLLPSLNEKTLFGFYNRQAANWQFGRLHNIEQETTYLVHAKSIFRHPEGWRHLKTLLNNNHLDLSALDHRASNEINLRHKVNVMVIGYRYEWLQLNDFDDEAADFFGHLLPFYNNAVFKQETVAQYQRYINALLTEHDLPTLTADGWDQFIRFSSRLADDNDRLTLDNVGLCQLFDQANAIARKDNKQQIDAASFDLALTQKQAVQSKVFGDVIDLYQKGVIHVDFVGEIIGQTNGLTVVETDGIEYGEPSRITASVFYGDGDIIDIERKSELGGNIHAKGVMLLSSFIAQKFAKNSPMHLSASLVFEQSYHEVDGDSATLAELCCLISALSEVPLKQTVAITGAVDQFGSVLAVGGVNEKIEGFYRIASTLQPNQVFTVILPESNVSQLNLADDCLQAVRSGKLVIYPVADVEQALSLLAAVDDNVLKNFEGSLVELLYARIETRLGQLEHEYEEKSLFDKFKGLFSS